MKLKKPLAALLTLTLLCGCGATAETKEGTPTPVPETAAPVTETTQPTPAEETAATAPDELSVRYPDAHILCFESAESADGISHSAVLDGEALEEFDYVWHADPSEAHDEVKNCPAEYYTGTAPETDAAAYITHDVYYYPALDESGFQKVNYDGEQEWAYYYTAEEYADYIFATLPVQGGGVPAQMMHTPEEAYENAVLNIVKPGTYVLCGTWHGQIRVDLGDADDTFTDENAKVTLILCGADVACSVAPALLVFSAYECDNDWENRESYSCTVDTADAGANVILADGTVNNFTGANVYRMLKAKYKNDDDTSAVPVQKKARKTDAAFYSYVSMNIDGEAEGSGVLNVTSTTFEGLDTELHLTVNGGNINVFSLDDGINVNEDGVSVMTMNGGTLHILAGLGSEGDGIDSNGFLVVNGGTLISAASPYSDSGMDSDCGTYVNGGTVLALGSAMDWAESDGSEAEGQAAVNLRFSGQQSADEAIIVADESGKVVFAYDPDKDEVAGSNARFYQGAILSAPGIVVGGTYQIYVGGDVTGEETAGVYDPDSVTGFTDDARLQGYLGTGELGGRGGMMPGSQHPEGMQMPEGMTPPEGMERPDGMPQQWNGPNQPIPGGFESGQMPRDGETPPEKPEGDDGIPQRPDDMGTQRPEDFGGQGGMTPPDGAMGGIRPEGFGADGVPGGELNTLFPMTGKVNGFTGVTDAA